MLLDIMSAMLTLCSFAESGKRKKWDYVLGSLNMKEATQGRRRSDCAATARRAEQRPIASLQQCSQLLRISIDRTGGEAFRVRWCC